MFGAIAPRYDLLNRVLSLGRDQAWRRALVARLPALGAGDRVLDLCTGTGDVALTLAGALPAGADVHAADFCEPMVVEGPRKAGAREPRPRFLVADALALPYADARFAAVSVAFGLRNVERPEDALTEMRRVLAPGGRLLILEFARPDNRVFARLYRWYFFSVLPRVGRLLSGSEMDAYRYLPESVWAFPGPEHVARQIEAAGLTVVEQRRFLLGAVVLHVADAPRP